MPFYDDGDLRAVAAAGHEIACHGFGHQPTPGLSSEAAGGRRRAQCRISQALFEWRRGGELCFPYGLASPRTKRFYASRFTNVRGVHPRLNSGRADLALLNAVSIEKRCWDSAAVARLITRARHDRAWIIFYTHDISDDPSPYGSTPAMLSETLERLAEARIEILPMREAVKAAIG